MSPHSGLHTWAHGRTAKNNNSAAGIYFRFVHGPSQTAGALMMCINDGEGKSATI